MVLRLQYWLLAGLSGVLLILVIANIWFYQGNVSQQQEVNGRQAFIQQVQQGELPLYREIVQALAELAARGDAQIGYLLTSQGIQVNTPQSAAPHQPAAQASQAAPAAAVQAAPAADNTRTGRVRTRIPPSTPAAPANKP